MALTIPSRHKTILSKLLQLPADQYTPLAAALSGLSAAPLSTERLTKDLASSAGLSTGDAGEVINLVIGLHSLPLFGYVESQDLVPEFLAALEEEKDPSIEPQEFDRFAKFIAEVLAIEPLRVVSRAVHLLYAYERYYCKAKILTDLRPVFDAEIGRPSAFVANHTLQLLVHRGRDMEEVYVSLGRDDLGELATLIQRARDKEDELRKLSDAAGVDFLTVEEKC